MVNININIRSLNLLLIQGSHLGSYQLNEKVVLHVLFSFPMDRDSHMKEHERNLRSFKNKFMQINFILLVNPIYQTYAATLAASIPASNGSLKPGPVVPRT